MEEEQQENTKKEKKKEKKEKKKKEEDLTKTVFIKNISYEMDEEQFRDFYKQFG